MNIVNDGQNAKLNEQMIRVRLGCRGRHALSAAQFPRKFVERVRDAMESRQIQYRELEELMQAEDKTRKAIKIVRGVQKPVVTNEAVNKNGTDTAKNVAGRGGTDEHGDKNTEDLSEMPRVFPSLSLRV